MPGAIIKSLLKETVKNLPDQKIKPQAVGPLLKKAGIKDEEVKYSGFMENLPKLPGGERYTKQDLVDAEAKRKDKFEVVELRRHDNRYAQITPDREGLSNPTYREKILTFKQTDAPEVTQPDDLGNLMGDFGFESNSTITKQPSRYNSPDHFREVDNYLVHTRVYDEDINGVKTHVVAEIQSDLHQAALGGKGYKTGGAVVEEYSDLEKRLLENPYEAQQAIYHGEDDPEYIEDFFSGFSIEEISDAYENLRRRVPEAEFMSPEELLTHIGPNATDSRPPKSPFEKTWLLKSLERELVDAVEAGKTQLAVPIKGDGVEDLIRSKGVQKNYETTVVKTMKKLADRLGAEFELTKYKPGATRWEITDNHEAAMRESFSAFATMRREHGESLGTEMFKEHESLKYLDSNERDELIKLYLDNNADVDDNLINKALSKVATKIVDPDEGLQYAIIKPKGTIAEPEDIPITKKEELASLSDAMDSATQEEMDYLDDIYARRKGGQFNLDKPFNFNLYSTPTAGAFAAYMAYQQGANDKQVAEKLRAQGFDDEDIADINEKALKIAEAKAKGATDEQIKNLLNGKELKAEVVESKPRSIIDAQGGPTQPGEGGIGGLAVPKRLFTDVKATAFENLKEAETLGSLVQSMNVIKPIMTSHLTDTAAYFGWLEFPQKYDEARRRSRTQIVNLAKDKFGYDIEWVGEGVGDERWVLHKEDGTTVDVTPGFWEELKSQSGEILGGTAGAILGFKAAPANPYAKAGGTLIGGITGAVLGTEFDYLREAMELQEDMEAEVAAHRALNATEMAVVGEVLGYGVVKVLGAGWKGIVRAKNFFLEGNTEGALKALQDNFGISTEQADEIVAQFERINGPMTGSQDQKRIQAAVLSERGMQDLVRVAGVIDPKASQNVIKVVDGRAQELLSSTAELTDPQIARTFIKDLQNYTTDVKNFYGNVKAAATNSPRAGVFAWDYEAIAIEPVLQRLKSKITDPVVSDKFLMQADRIRSFSESRTFGDLIEFRQIVNDFRYNSRITKADDKKMLTDMINDIDSVIEEGAGYVFHKPDEWLNNWAEARKQYTKMKRVEKTSLARMIFDKDGNVRPVNPENVIKGMSKYIGALDGSFEEVLSKIPPKGRAQYEGAVVNHLADKFTEGAKGGMRATNFPGLAKELDRVNLTTPDARAMKKAISEMAEVFKNDVFLAQATGKIEIPKFQSYLTTDPVVRAKFEIASGIFNKLKTWAPGDAQRNLALVKQTAKLLEKPLDAKTSKALMAEYYDDVNMTDAIKRIQQEAAKARANGKDLVSPRIYVDASGKLTKDTSARAIPTHRIATEEQVKTIADSESITVDNPMLDSILKKHGILAVAQGTDRVRLLGAK